MKQSIALELVRVKKNYQLGTHTVHALRGISVAFYENSFTAIMGPSGSGKSTLLHCAAGLERASSGDISVASTNITKLNEKQLTKLRRGHIGFIFQEFNLLPSLSAEQNVALPLKLAKRYSQNNTREALAKVGLDGRGSHLPSQLSGGQQQRVGIARALAMQPKVIFADEPTGALDTTSSKEILALLRQAVDTHSQTVVMVTHDPRAASYADRVLFLADGQIQNELASPSTEVVARTLAAMER